ncbi:hypothetical protein HMPREF9372_3248 [Sporosarcina newyorkensis 2681]|uniref:Uncharacterized protein n=1 Tax=Sporosarcina newyorkensis 2681 TaxID=1027292 RepID=F9DWR7_9BACL|nr:hypothetical protein HMPREF9372_3248 [Sporosarcina newyorkensis 2681]
MVRGIHYNNLEVLGEMLKVEEQLPMQVDERNIRGIRVYLY